MKVRTKAFLQTIGGLSAGAGVVFGLDYFFPKYGLLIWFSGILLYLIWIMFQARVSILENEQNRIVDELKK